MNSKKINSIYRMELFQQLDGVVLIPTFLSLIDTKITDTIYSKNKFTLNDIKDDINKGYLNVALRLLYSLKFLDSNESFYKKNKAFDDIYMLLNSLNSLNKLTYFHINFNSLTNSEHEDYSNILKNNIEKISNSNISNDILINISGFIGGPIISNLGFNKKIKIENNKLYFNNLNENLKDSITLLFNFLNFVSNTNTLTDKGEFFLNRSASYGVTVSYLPMLNNINKLLKGNGNFIYQRLDNHEIHVDRSMNVWGSGGAHKIYFKKIDTIIKKIFNKDIKQQPLGIIDVGCGDGTFLAHLYKIITTETKRKEFLETHPLVMIGTDINEKARLASSEKLKNKNIKHVIIDGNIGNPKNLYKDLKNNYNYNLSDFLNTRTFLDHNRIYEKTEYIPNNINTSGAFAFKGQLISKEDLTSNLISHFKKWAPYVKQHGLILLELHTLDTDLIRKNIGNTLSAAYDATHGFSDQYLIEHSAFLECIKKAELSYSKDDMILFPNNKIPTISINYIK